MEGSSELDGVIWRNILGMAISFAIIVPFTQALSIYWQVFLLELDATPLIISLMYGVSSIVSAISMIYGGYLADRHGRKKLIAVFTFFTSLTFLAMYYATTWQEIFIIYILQGLMGIYSPAVDAIIADSAPVQKRGKAYSIIFLIPRIMAVGAPYIALMFVVRYGLVHGMRRLMILAFITCALAALIRAGFLRETLKERKAPRYSPAQYKYREVLNYVVKNIGGFLVFLVILMFTLGLIYLEQLYVLVYLRVDYEAWAYIIIMYMMITIALTIPSGMIVDRVGRRASLVASVVLAVISQAILDFAPIGGAKLHVAVSFILFAFANSLGFTAYLTMMADLLPHEQRGRAYAVLRILESAAGILGAIAGGLLYMLYPRLPFIAATILSILGLIVSIMLGETLPKRVSNHGGE